ncbi:peptidase, partial [Acinetobacter schindleri]
SFASPLRSNVSVGMPLDVLVYKKDSLMMPKGKRIAEDDEYFTDISRQWSETLKKGLAELPTPSNDYFL